MNFVNFPVGPFLFSTGGVIFLLGIVLATWMLTRTVHEKGLSLKFLHNYFLFFAGSAFLVGRLGALGKFWTYFEGTASTLSAFEYVLLFCKKFIFFWHGGVDTFWTAIGFLLAFLIVARRKQENVWKWLDAFTLPTILLLAFWSLGAFFSAWDYGKPVSDSFWFGITYDVQGVRYSVPLHPVQIYAFLYYGGLFGGGLKWWRAHFPKKPGTFFGVMVFLVFLGNGFLEFFRGDPAPMLEIGSFEVRVPQFVSFLLVLCFAVLWAFRTHSDSGHHEQKGEE